MKKILVLVALVTISMFVLGQNRDSWTEDFNDNHANYYGTSFTFTISGTWTCQDAGNFAYANSTMGSYAFTINDDKPDAQITTPALNTCGTVTFKYAYKNGSSTNVFVLQKSTDGTTFTDLDTHTLGASAEENYVTYTYDVNDASSSVYIRVLSDDQDAHLFIEDFQVTNYSSGPDNPTNFTASTVSTSEIDLSWNQNAAGDDVMVAYTSDGTFGTPTDGTTYSVGDAISGGGTVIYNGSGTSYNHTGLTSGTQYYYKAWSVDGSANYSSGVTADATTYKDEPTNHASSFAAGTPGPISIPLTWNDNDGTVAADYFLVMINTTGTFTPPVDGTPQADDTDVSDGDGVVNVAHGTEAYTWNNLSQGTTYYFTIYPYTNSGSAINYKTDGTVPTASATTTTANTDLIISEVTDPNDTYQAKFVELYNTSSDTIFFTSETWYLSRQANGSSSSWADIQLTDTLPPGEAYTIAYNTSYFNTAYGFDPDQTNVNISGNGNDGYFLYYGGDHNSGTLIDAYGVIDEDGTGKDWEYLDSKAVRKRSVGSPNSTWTASEWVITSADVVNMTPGQHFNYVNWQGTTDTDWNTKSNWDNGFIPDASMDVTIGSTSNDPVVSGDEAICYDLHMGIGGDLTIDTDGKLTVINDFNSSKALYTVTINSDASGQGSLIVEGSASVEATVKCYTTAGQWHSISAPVSGLTANSYYLGGSPDVWMKEWSEADTIYNYITSLSTSMGDMKGWMLWIGGSTAQTFSLEGNIRTGTVGSANNMTRSGTDTIYGYNFVGNPFTATLDWDASSGWTKTNIDDATYVYNNGNWASYAGGTGTNGGSRYIAMNQGFFVQVNDDGSTAGTLQITTDALVHNATPFLKSGKKERGYDEILRLEVNNGALADETVIRLSDDATEGFDGNLDAHKLFSFNTNHPQIFSTANGNMSINSLPPATGSIALDVRGADGDNMTIRATETAGFSHVYLTDEKEGITTDLVRDNYPFVYDQNFTNRFTLSFMLNGVDENSVDENIYKVFSSNGQIHVIQPAQNNLDITVYNLLGQKITELKGNGAVQLIPVSKTGYYVVKVSGNQNTETFKVFVK